MGRRDQERRGKGSEGGGCSSRGFVPESAGALCWPASDYSKTDCFLSCRGGSDNGPLLTKASAYGLADRSLTDQRGPLLHARRLTRQSYPGTSQDVRASVRRRSSSRRLAANRQPLRRSSVLSPTTIISLQPAMLSTSLPLLLPLLALAQASAHPAASIVGLDPASELLEPISFPRRCRAPALASSR